MFIDTIQQELKKLKNTVCVVVKYFMFILVILKEESFVHMNALINHMLKLKTRFVRIAEKLLNQIHRQATYVVHGNVELLGQKQKYGLHEKNYLFNVLNAGKNFGLNFLHEQQEKVSSVLVSAKSILKKLTIYLRQVFMVLLCGIKHAKEYWNEITALVNIVVFRKIVFMFTIRNTNVMAEMNQTKTLLHYVQDVTVLNILTIRNLRTELV